MEPYTLTDVLWVLDRTITEEIHDIGIGMDIWLGIALFPVENRPRIDADTPRGLFLLQSKVKPPGSNGCCQVNGSRVSQKLQRWP